MKWDFAFKDKSGPRANTGLHRDPLGTGPLGRIGKDRKGQERISGALKNEFLQKSTKMLKITQNSNFGGPGLC